MGIEDIFGQMAETLGGAVDGVQDIIADPQSAIGELAGQALGESAIADVAGALGGDLTEGVPGLEGFDPASAAENLGGAAEGLEGIVGDLGGMLEGSPLEEAAGGLGGMLEDSPLGGVLEGLGGFFGRN